MKITENIGMIDRYLRVIMSEVLFLGAYFWFGGVAQMILMILGLVMLLTAFFGFCGAYKLFGITTYHPERDTVSVKASVFFAALFVIVLLAGSYYSNFFSRKFFLDDYSRMNNFYKQTLFYTGQNDRGDAINNYEKLVVEYAVFEKKYTTYHPYALKSDTRFDQDIISVAGIIDGLNTQVHTGDLKQAHVTLEEIRPIFQDILKRNNFSLLAVALVDFHDAMEKIITAADAKNSKEVIALYPEVSEKLTAVEQITNDAEVQMIRQKLEEVVSLAREDNSSAFSVKAAEMKSAFVKVYLKRG